MSEAPKKEKKGGRVKGTVNKSDGKLRGFNVKNLEKWGYPFKPPIPATQFGGDVYALRLVSADYKVDGKGKAKKLFASKADGGLFKSLTSGRLYHRNEEETGYIELTEEEYDSITKEYGEKKGLKKEDPKSEGVDVEPRIGTPYQGRKKDEVLLKTEDSGLGKSVSPLPPQGPGRGRKKGKQPKSSVSDFAIANSIKMMDQLNNLEDYVEVDVRLVPRRLLGNPENFVALPVDELDIEQERNRQKIASRNFQQDTAALMGGGGKLVGKQSLRAVAGKGVKGRPQGTYKPTLIKIAEAQEAKRLADEELQKAKELKEAMDREARKAELFFSDLYISSGQQRIRLGAVQPIPDEEGEVIASSFTVDEKQYLATPVYQTDSGSVAYGVRFFPFAGTIDEADEIIYSNEDSEETDETNDLYSALVKGFYQSPEYAGEFEHFKSEHYGFDLVSLYKGTYFVEFRASDGRVYEDMGEDDEEDYDIEFEFDGEEKTYYFDEGLGSLDRGQQWYSSFYDDEEDEQIKTYIQKDSDLSVQLTAVMREEGSRAGSALTLNLDQEYLERNYPTTEELLDLLATAQGREFTKINPEDDDVYNKIIEDIMEEVERRGINLDDYELEKELEEKAPTVSKMPKKAKTTRTPAQLAQAKAAREAYAALSPAEKKARKEARAAAKKK